MSAPLFTLPSASQEDLQNACGFIRSECSCNRRPYDVFSVVCGGLRPLYSGSPIEAEIIASVCSLLSPPPPNDGAWHRRPNARYVPAAQELLFKCGGLDVLVACLGYPSALNKPAIARCIALAVGMQPGHISRAVDLGVLSSLSDALSHTMTSGIFHNNCASFAMAVEALVDSSSKLQNDADAVGLGVLLVNSILTSIGGNGHEVLHHFFWAIAAMCRGNTSVVSSFARAGAPGACVRALASCSKSLVAEAALDVLSLFVVPLETAAVPNPAVAPALNDMPFSGAIGHTKLAVSQLLTSDQAVSKLAAFAKAASKHGRSISTHIALTTVLAAATLDFATTASVLERTSSKSSSDNARPSASSCGSLVQSCISCIVNNHSPQLCTQLIAKLVPISVFAREFINHGGISVLFACMHSNYSLSSFKFAASALVELATHQEDQFISGLESAAWCEIAAAVDALLQKMKELREKRMQQAILADGVKMLQMLSSLPISFHFRMMSLMLSSMAIEIVLCCVISSHICSDPELRGCILAALQFVLTLMDFDLSIKPVRDSKTAHGRAPAVTTGAFMLDAGEYHSAASLIDVAPLIPDLLNLFSSSISAVIATSDSGKDPQNALENASQSISDSSKEHRAILLCILRVLIFLVDNPLAADVTGAAGGIELLVKLFLFGEEEHKKTVLTVLRMLHAHNDMNRQILARLIGKLPHATKSAGKILLKEHQPWLRSPSKTGSATQTLPSIFLEDATCQLVSPVLPDAFKRHASSVQHDSRNGHIRSDARKLRLKPICHQLPRASSTAPPTSHPAPILPYLLAPLSKIFESYSSSDRMSAKHLRKFCHDFALTEAHSRAIMLSHADISASCGDELSFSNFVEAVSAACSALHLALSQFLCEIGAKNVRAVSVAVDAARERSLLSQRIEQTKRAVFVHVDQWKDRQFGKMRKTLQNLQHAHKTADEPSAQTSSKGKELNCNFLSYDNGQRQPPRSRSVQVQRKSTQQPMPHKQQLESRPLADEVTLWAEFGCLYAK